MREPSSLGGPERPLLALGAALAIFGSSACAIDVPVGDNPLDRRQVADVPPDFRHELDLLFVVEDSADLAAVHGQLGGLWERVRGHLAFAEGGFPEVRIGVVSSDLGVGADGQVAGCSAAGDAGALRPGIDGSAWLDVDAADPAAADPAIAQRLQLGVGTCPFEQPLAAMQRALDGSASGNLGFVRDSAALGVVFVAGADDCSIASPSFFADGAPVGDTFRCFRDAVHCIGDDVGDYEPGVQEGCVARDVNEHLMPLDYAQAFLGGVKVEPDALAVGALVGNPGRVALEDRDGALAVSLACAEGAGGSAMYPGVRIGAFADSSEVRGAVADLCTTTVADAGTQTALDLRRALGHRCLEERIADVRPDQPGLQFDCTVRTADDRELVACPNPYHVLDAEGPCWAIKPGPAECGDFPSQLALQVNWGPLTPTRLLVSCLVDPPIVAVH